MLRRAEVADIVVLGDFDGKDGTGYTRGGGGGDEDVGLGAVVGVVQEHSVTPPAGAVP